MEKTISVEERIKRAEEIYNRRTSQNDNIRYTYNRKKTNNAKGLKFDLIKKMITQILLCFLIYAVFYVISNSEYIFSEDFRNNVNSLLNTQMDFKEIYNDAKSYFSEWLSTSTEEIVDNIIENGDEKQKESLNSNEQDDQQKSQTENEEGSQEEIQNTVEESKIDIQENISETLYEQADGQMQKQEEINIGGANEENAYNSEEISKENNEPQNSQMEIDAEDIKKSISFEVPVKGYISSKFGIRNPSTSTVPKNHTGLDIAATTGTVIKSATDGTVTLVSSYGDYGKHYKIQIDDVVIIYAHCSKLYLKEGDTVTKGQSIAEVGSTGNSTGPHLHFEIRKDGRLVDPQLILNI